MSLTSLLTRPSTIVSVTASGTKDEYGNPAAGTPTRTATLCYLEPWRATAGEQDVDRATTSDDWLYVVPAGTTLTSIDHIEVDGETGTFEVVGEPAALWNPRKRAVSHIEARLRRTGR